MTRPLRMDREDGVVRITLDRPAKLNAITMETYRALRDVFPELSADESIRAIVLTGAGRGFCAGGDIDEIIGDLVRRSPRGLMEFTHMTGAVVRNIRRCRVPVIAAVNGVAVGAGAVIALACDIRIASEHARFGFVFPQVGLSGADMGAAVLLPRVVGFGRAMELLLTGDIIDAAEAYRIGLANRVVPAERLMEEAMALARRLAQGPIWAHEVTKRQVEDEWTMALEPAIENESQVQAFLMAHQDFREAYERWRRRKPGGE
jgi:enoyl-CoA hydratase/carnithine racemase